MHMLERIENLIYMHWISSFDLHRYTETDSQSNRLDWESVKVRLTWQHCLWNRWLAIVTKQTRYISWYCILYSRDKLWLIRQPGRSFLSTDAVQMVQLICFCVMCWGINESAWMTDGPIKWVFLVRILSSGMTTLTNYWRCISLIDVYISVVFSK